MGDFPGFGHKCGDRCTCPVHGTLMWFAPGANEHACADIDCVYGHGYEKALGETFYEDLSLVRAEDQVVPEALQVLPPARQ